MNRIQDRFQGALMGLAVGDALGTTLEFSPPGTFQPIDDMVGGGPFNLPVGYWTDDGSMALCLAESLIFKEGLDLVDQARRYMQWWHNGKFSSRGDCFDIGMTVSMALRSFETSGQRLPYCGAKDKYSAGNGSIMRLAPVPMAFFRDPLMSIRASAESSRTTHQAPEAVDACRLLGLQIWAALNGATKAEILSPTLWATYASAEPPLAEAIEAISLGNYKTMEPPAIQGTGYVVRSLEAALWAFHRTDNFRDAVLAAANLGNDADTTAAETGQLAGAFYGLSGIPAKWVENVVARPAASPHPSGQIFLDFANQLLELQATISHDISQTNA